MATPVEEAAKLVEQAPTVADKALDTGAGTPQGETKADEKIAGSAQKAANAADNSPATPQNDVQQQQTAGPKADKGLTQKFKEGAQGAANRVLSGSKEEQKRQKTVQGLLRDANLPEEEFKKLPKNRQNAAKKQQSKVDKAQQKLENALDAPASGDWASVGDNMMKVLDAQMQLNKESGGPDTMAGRLTAVGKGIANSATVGPLLKGGKAAITAPIKAVKKLTQMAKSQGMTPEEALKKKCKEDGMSPEQMKEKLDQWKLTQQQAQGVTQLAAEGVQQQAPATPEAEEPTPTAALEQANEEEADLGVTTPGLGSTSSNN